MEIRSLNPQALWNHFADLNEVPRASKKEAQVIAFMKNFGTKLGLETIVDEVGNVIIKKPATNGMEQAPTVVMQSHLDMVHQKNNDTDFDFDTEGIKMYIDGDWVKAKGTTLGADNGIGVATIMAILSSTDIPHPAIEALFTIDEETGMTGAKGLKGGLLTGKYLLNLDTEDDSEITIGCAGGIDVTIEKQYDVTTAPKECHAYNIIVSGLNGGHSGMQIHEGLGNANKIMNRILYALNKQVEIHINSIQGGGLRNAIPRESHAIVFINNYSYEEAKRIFDITVKDIEQEYAKTESNIAIKIERNTDAPNQVMQKNIQNQILNALYSAHNGVFRMSPQIDGLVEASNNIAKVNINNGKIEILCLTRSSVESSKADVVFSLTSCFENIGATVTTSGDYPGWAPNNDSNLLKIVKEEYTNHYNKEPHVSACHAGLECGILGTNYPDMEMISFGPTIQGAHSPDERVNIASVEQYWKFVLNILKNIK